jgi:hypothetical protein
MEETGVLENRALFNYMLPDLEPGQMNGTDGVVTLVSKKTCKG